MREVDVKLGVMRVSCDDVWLVFVVLAKDLQL